MDYSVVLDSTRTMRSFLELAQPLDVKYGYIRGVAKENSYITFRNVSTNIRRGIGNQYISERVNYVITVQTKTAEQNLIYSAMIKYATSETNVLFVSEDLRRDTLVENGWINTIIVNVFNSADVVRLIYTKEEATELLQAIADRYVMITSLYKDPISESVIDKFTVPELEHSIYSLSEVQQLKQEYLDRLVLTITEY